MIRSIRRNHHVWIMAILVLVLPLQGMRRCYCCGGGESTSCQSCVNSNEVSGQTKNCCGCCKSEEGSPCCSFSSSSCCASTSELSDDLDRGQTQGSEANIQNSETDIEPCKGCCHGQCQCSGQNTWCVKPKTLSVKKPNAIVPRAFVTTQVPLMTSKSSWLDRYIGKFVCAGNLKQAKLGVWLN